MRPANVSSAALLSSAYPKRLYTLVTPPSAWFSTRLIVETGIPDAAMPVPELTKLVKPKVYQKTYQSGFAFHYYYYKSDIYKILMAEGEG